MMAGPVLLQRVLSSLDLRVRASPLRALDASATFSEIVSAYTPFVWRVLRCLGVHDADLDDLCQETFMIVHRKLPSFEHRSALRTWIYGIAFRVASDERKRAHRKREILVAQVVERPGAAVQEQAIAQRQDWELLERLFATLSDDQRRVFVLYEVEELTMREICEVVQCPLQTAYSRLHTARARIAQTLEAIRAQEVGP